MAVRVVAVVLFVLLWSGSLSAETYWVVKGDSLASLSQKLKVPDDILLRANPGESAQTLRAGDPLWVPGRYSVKAGDTLYSLCRLWGVDQQAVLALNGLAQGSGLKRGQILFIPEGPAAKNKQAPSPIPVPAPTSGTPSPQGSLFWPVDKSPRAEGNKLKAVTFSTSGEPFRSVSQGTVVYLGEFRGVGRVLLVQKADKTVFGYGNFENSAVEFGQTVSKGQVLGTTSPRPSQKLTFFAFLQTDSLDVFTINR